MELEESIERMGNTTSCWRSIAALSACVWIAIGGWACEPSAPPGEPSGGDTAVESGRVAVLKPVASAIGVSFRHQPGPERFFIPQEMGPGGAFLDADGDGALDLYLIQGGRLPGDAMGSGGPEGSESNRLFRNTGDGEFVDVTEASGAGDRGYGMGCAVADVDSDGDSDLYLTNVGPDVLLLNDGSGKFTDGTAASGLGDSAFGSSAAFADYDGDGHLDLFVSVYVPWSPDIEKPCFDPQGRQDYCNPTVYPPGQDRLYRGRGDGTFEEATSAAGLGNRPAFGLGAVWCDFDRDGDLDLYVANDHQPNFLWVNEGDGTFAERGTELGCAYNAQGEPEAGMGIICEDFDHDGDFDLLITHFHGESNTFYRNHGTYFEDETAAVGLDRYGVDNTSFGAVAFDVENNGEWDVFIANGGVMRARKPEDPKQPYAERNLLLGFADDAFRDRSADHKDSVGRLGMSRGVIMGDYDSDGDVDLVVCNNRGNVEILRNESRGGAGLLVSVVGGASGREAIGARVTWYFSAEDGALLPGGMRQKSPYSSYQVTHDPRLHFGLGSRTVATLEVSWPSGRIERFPSPTGIHVTLREGEGTALSSPIGPGPSSTDISKANKSGASTSGDDPPSVVIDPDLQPLTATPRFPIRRVEFPEGDAFREHVANARGRGELAPALKLANDWVRETIQQAGLDHYHMLDSVTTFAQIAEELDRTRDAISLYEKAVDEYAKADRKDHPILIRFWSSLGQLHANGQETEQAERAFHEALRIATQNFGTASRECASLRTILARFYLDQNRMPEAEALTLFTYRAGMAQSRESFGLVQLLASAGRIAREDGRPTDAVRHYEQAAAAYARLDVSRSERAKVAFSLGELYLDLRDYNRAVDRFGDAKRWHEEEKGSDHLEALLAGAYLAESKVARGDVADGVADLESLLERFRLTRGPRDLVTVTTARKLAEGYGQQKRYAEAIELLRLARDVYRERYPAGHEATVAAEKSLRNLERAAGQ